MSPAHGGAPIQGVRLSPFKGEESWALRPRLYPARPAGLLASRGAEPPPLGPRPPSRPVPGE